MIIRVDLRSFFDHNKAFQRLPVSSFDNIRAHSI